MKRREFITLLGGATASWPVPAWAQQPTIPTIGFLSSRSASDSVDVVAAFRRGLKEGGFIEGENVAIAFRWAEGKYDRLPALAVNLVTERVAVIVATGGPPSTLAAMSATADIPIVFTSGDDPIRYGLVASLNRPGGNITGVNFMAGALGAKQLELLREMVPQAVRVALLVNPDNRHTETAASVDSAARIFSQQVQTLMAATEADLDTAFATLAFQRADGLVVSADPFYLGRRERIVGLASRYQVPAVYFAREFVAAGGLMSYGADIADAYRLVAVYTGRILKGARPADLPVIQPTKFELIINMETARALGLTVPPSLLSTADEVIE